MMRLITAIMLVSSIAGARPECPRLAPKDLDQAQTAAAAEDPGRRWDKVMSELETDAKKGPRYAICVAYHVLDWSRRTGIGQAVGRAVTYLTLHGEKVLDQAPDSAAPRSVFNDIAPGVWRPGDGASAPPWRLASR